MDKNNILNEYKDIRIYNISTLVIYKKLKFMSLSELFASLKQANIDKIEDMDFDRTSMNMTYKMNFDAILDLPIVKKIIEKNKILKRENKSLKNLIYSLPEFRSKKKSNRKIRNKRFVCECHCDCDCCNNGKKRTFIW